MNKKISLEKVLQLPLIVASVVLSFYFYHIFPARVPLHWGVDGEVNGWGPSLIAAFLLPVILIAIYFLFDLLPKIDPKKANYPDFKKAYAVFKTAIMAVLFAVYIISSLNALGIIISVSFWIPICIGVLFIFLGSYFGTLRSNYFIGIRTPWTLSSESVWNKTHQVGGKLFIVGGIALMGMGFMPTVWRMPLFIAIIILVAIVPMVYSYILYRKEKA